MKCNKSNTHGIRFALVLMLVAYMMGVKAQSISVPPTPVEMMQGHKKFYSLLVVNRPLELESSWDFFNVTTFSANNHNEVSRNEFFSTSLISYPVYHNVRVASGVNLNSVVGLNYFSGFQYSRMNGHWLIVLVPGIYFKDKSSFEALALMEFTPPISKRLKLYTRIHALYNAGLADWHHNRSYNYLRLGLTVGSISFGVGLNADWYGPFRLLEKNYGIFIRTELP